MRHQWLALTLCFRHWCQRRDHFDGRGNVYDEERLIGTGALFDVQCLLDNRLKFLSIGGCGKNGAVAVNE